MARVNKPLGKSLERPLCRRYALVLVSPFNVDIATWDVTNQQRWRWALGMLADGECEALGAWPATATQDFLLRECLRERGVERIDGLLGDEPLARRMGVPVAVQPMKGAGVVARARASQLHAKIERAVSRATPFSGFHSVCACVGRILEQAELAELARQRRSLRAQWRARGLQTPAPATRL